jgi:lysozyme
MNRARLSKQLELDEGKKARIYLDTATPPRWTGGVGRNLSDRAFSEDEIQLMLSNDIDLATKDARQLVPGFDHLSDARQEAIVNFLFNVGYTTASKFKKSFMLLNSSRFSEAADEFLNSTWATQVGKRAIRITDAIREG